MKLSNCSSFLSYLLFSLQLFYLSVISDSMIRRMSKLNWQIVSKNEMNSQCIQSPNGTCSGKCPFSGKRCTMLWNYDTKVCGCKLCFFNGTTNRCYGQCNNLVLGTCLSTVDIPKSDSDCDCKYCKASLFITKDGTEMPKCKASRCGPHNCSPIKINGNKSTLNLECICNYI